MKTSPIPTELIRLVAAHAADENEPVAADEFPPVPRARLWAEVARVLPASQPRRGDAAAADLGRLARWMDAMDRALRWGCPVPATRLMEWMEGLASGAGWTMALDDAPGGQGTAGRWEQRCLAMAREARRMQSREWDAIADRLEAWATVRRRT